MKKNNHKCITFEFLVRDQIYSAGDYRMMINDEKAMGTT